MVLLKVVPLQLEVWVQSMPISLQSVNWVSMREQEGSWVVLKRQSVKVHSRKAHSKKLQSVNLHRSKRQSSNSLFLIHSPARFRLANCSW